MNVLSLFAGIGGLDLGFERAGMTVVGQVELDPWCRRVLTKHWPEVPQHDDIRTAIDWWFSEPRPVVDVIVGGYPCQGESSAGRRRGLDDERWLWPEMARLVHAIRPRYVVGENVPGHRTRGLRFVLRDLERLGYDARAGTLSAAEMGAPHRRIRVFTIAAHTDNSDRIQPGRGSWPHWASATELADDGRTRPVAHPDRDGRGSWSRPDERSPLQPSQSGPVKVAHTGDRGSDAGHNMADPVSVAGRTRRPGEPDEGPGERHAGGGGVSAHNMAEPGGPGLALPGRGGRGEGLEPAAEQGRRPAEPCVGGSADGVSAWLDGTWELGLDRVARGVPQRVRRLKGLGNAVVPQVAERVARIVVELERQRVGS